MSQTFKDYYKEWNVITTKTKGTILINKKFLISANKNFINSLLILRVYILYYIFIHTQFVLNKHLKNRKIKRKIWSMFFHRLALFPFAILILFWLKYAEMNIELRKLAQKTCIIFYSCQRTRPGENKYITCVKLNV